jgi:hypothetical protein
MRGAEADGATRMTNEAGTAALRLVQGETRRLLDEQFAVAQFAWVEGHLGLLCILRSVLGNDLDKVIILAVIGQQVLRGLVPADESSAALIASLTDGMALDTRVLTNIESIATATGIPRESVRRKVGELVAAGWIERLETGGLMICAPAVAALQPATDHTTAFLDRLVAGYVAMMVAGGRIAVGPAVAWE